MPDQDGQQVSESTHKDEHIERDLGSARLEDGLEKDCSCDLRRLGELFFRHWEGKKIRVSHRSGMACAASHFLSDCVGLTGSKVCNVAENIKDGDEEYGNDAVLPDDGNGSLNLVDDVEGVCIARVGEDNVDKSSREVIPVVCRAGKGVAVVQARVRDMVDVLSEDDETGDADAIWEKEFVSY